MNLLSSLVTPKTIFVMLEGHPPFHANDTHPAFDDIKTALTFGEYDQLPELFNVGKAIVRKSKLQAFDIVGNNVYIDGEQVRGVIVDRILDKASRGADVDSLVHFQRKLNDNPSMRVRDQLYEFIERGKQIGITDDGNIMAFKIVRRVGLATDFNGVPTTFVSHYDGTTRHDLGTVVEMDRTKVNDDPEQTCSYGLHACSEGYLNHYGSGPDSWVIAVEIDPADVVSIPVDYNAAKMRCAKYRVAAVLGPQDYIQQATAPQLDQWESFITLMRG